MIATTVPLAPRHDDGVLRVISIGRISTVHQSEDSIEASHEVVRRFLDTVYNGLMEVEALGA